MDGRQLAKGLKSAYAMKATCQTTTALVSVIVARIEDSTSYRTCFNSGGNLDKMIEAKNGAVRRDQRPRQGVARDVPAGHQG